MSAQWVLSGLVGAGCVYAADITTPAGATQVIFVTSFPDGMSVLTHDDSDAMAEALASAVRALPGAACTLSAVTFNGMRITEFGGAIPADLAFPAATWANYAAGFPAKPADGVLAERVIVQAGIIAASPADGVLPAATLAALNTAWAGAAAGRPGVTGPVVPSLVVISPASVI